MRPTQNLQPFLRQPINVRKSTSLTSSITNKPTDPSQQIIDTFSKLHETIDNLDSKVNLLLQKHEAEFLYAWRNHIKKIRKQLFDIKLRTDEKERMINSNEKLIKIEKQMTLFRDESLRLYEELEDRKNELDIYKRKLKEQQIDLEMLRQENKEHMKRARMAEAKSTISQQKMQQVQKQLLSYKQADSTPQRSTFNNKFSVYSSLTKDNFITKMKRKTVGFETLKQTGNEDLEMMNSLTLKENDSDSFAIPVIKLQKLNRLSVTQKHQSTTNKSDNHNPQFQEFSRRAKRMSLTANVNNSFVVIEPTVYEQDLKIWFLDCVKAIKKQISSRKTGFSSTSTDILTVQSLDEFKTIDKLRLLEMFLENEKMLVYMYQKIFPDRLKEIQNYLKVSTEQKQQKNSKNNSHVKAADILESHRQLELDFIYASNQKSLYQEPTRDDRESHKKNRVKSVTKASMSQPIKSKIIIRDGKLGLKC